MGEKEKMYITQETDYAIRIVNCLAKSENRRDARSISDEVNVSLRFSLKILGKLTSAGILKSYKGNRGGYEVSRAPSDITLYDVFTAIEGPYILARCIPTDGGNCDKTMCAYRQVFESISNDVNQKLSAISFQEMIEKEACC